MMLSVLLAMTLGADPLKIDGVEPTSNVQGLHLFPKRMQSHIAALRTPIVLERALPETNLKDVLELLQDLATPAEAVKDPGKRVSILIDDSAFRRYKADPAYKVEDERVNLPKLNGVTLETALRRTSEQVNGTFVVRRDHILLTTWESAIDLPLREYQNRTLILWAVEKQPLNEVLTAIGDHYEISIIVSNQAAEKAKRPVSAKFYNVPIEIAVETLAEMNGLEVVRKTNLYFLVDPNSKSEPEAEAEPIRTLPRETKNDNLSRRFAFPIFTR